jgi:hypothetical protein
MSKEVLRQELRVRGLGQDFGVSVAFAASSPVFYNRRRVEAVAVQVADFAAMHDAAVTVGADLIKRENELARGWD